LRHGSDVIAPNLPPFAAMLALCEIMLTIPPLPRLPLPALQKKTPRPSGDGGVFQASNLLSANGTTRGGGDGFFFLFGNPSLVFFSGVSAFEALVQRERERERKKKEKKKKNKAKAQAQHILSLFLYPPPRPPLRQKKKTTTTTNDSKQRQATARADSGREPATSSMLCCSRQTDSMLGDQCIPFIPAFCPTKKRKASALTPTPAASKLAPPRRAPPRRQPSAATPPPTPRPSPAPSTTHPTRPVGAETVLPPAKRAKSSPRRCGMLAGMLRVVDATPPTPRAQLPLVERYQPDAPSGLVGNGAALRSMTQWLRERAQGSARTRRAAFVSGPPGCGKSALVRACAVAAGLEPNVIAADAARRIADGCAETEAPDAPGAFGSTLFERVVSMASQRSLFQPFAVVVEDLDAACSVLCGGTNNLADVREAERLVAALEAMPAAASPIVFVCSDTSRRACRRIQQACFDVRMQAVGEREMVALALSVAEREGVPLSREACFQIAVASRGDIRAMLHALDVAMRGGRRGGDADADPRELARHGDVFSSDCFQAAKLMLHARCEEAEPGVTRTADGNVTLAGAMQLYERDPTLAQEMVHRNYLRPLERAGRRRPTSAATLEDAWQAAEMLSAADAMTGCWPASGGEAVGALFSRGACATYCRSDASYPAGRDRSVDFPSTLLRRTENARRASSALSLSRCLGSCPAQDLPLVASLTALRVGELSISARSRGEEDDGGRDEEENEEEEEEEEERDEEENEDEEEGQRECARTEALRETGYLGTAGDRRRLVDTLTELRQRGFDSQRLAELVDVARERLTAPGATRGVAELAECARMAEDGLCSNVLGAPKRAGKRASPMRTGKRDREWQRESGREQKDGPSHPSEVVGRSPPFRRPTLSQRGGLPHRWRGGAREGWRTRFPTHGVGPLPKSPPSARMPDRRGGIAAMRGRQRGGGW
jgi:hypothetical protein